MVSTTTSSGSIRRVTVTPARPYHHGNLRAELLEAAERTLDERGTGLSLRGLARELGVSHGAPRRHFADKQALLDALAEDGFERLGRELAGAIAAAGGEAPSTGHAAFEARFAAFARAYVAFATRHAALLELMFAVKHRTSADSTLREAADHAFAPPLGLIVEAQTAEAVVAGDPKEVGTVAVALLQGLAAMANGGMLADAPLDEVVNDAVRRLLLGLRPR